MSSAIEIIGNQARTEILRSLAAQGPLTSVELAERIGTSRKSAHAHLGALEAAGIVTGDLKASDRQGRTVRWAVDPERVGQIADTWLSYVTPQGLARSAGDSPAGARRADGTTSS